MTTRTPTAIVLTIPGYPAYSLSPNARSHWAVKQRETKDAHWQVKQALGDMPINPITTPYRLHWTIYLERGGKKRDPDNAIACLKAHMDALVREGILPGDSPRWLIDTPTIEQIIWGTHRGEARITVRIEPQEEA